MPSSQTYVQSLTKGQALMKTNTTKISPKFTAKVRFISLDELLYFFCHLIRNNYVFLFWKIWVKLYFSFWKCENKICEIFAVKKLNRSGHGATCLYNLSTQEVKAGE
jgi:hypothetical protein